LLREIRGGAPLSSSYLSLESAIAASSTAPRTFLIGGAQLYSLALTSRPTLVDRVLLTRIISDLSCDTFLTDFTTHREEGKAVWRLASHEELEKWVGFEVPKGEVEEQGVRYHFEMWELAGKAPDSA
jgi:dihydrofolate reductase